ncbi:MAG TPA: hypothetical protein VGB02_12260 [Pyrinomonadaceae bacterium]|jgi:fatty acid-binding protein DegV
MAKKKHHPENSPALVIRYLRADPDQNEVVKKVRGKTEAVEWLEKFTKIEKEPKKYRFLWRWEDPQAALEYELEQLNKAN